MIIKKNYFRVALKMFLNFSQIPWTPKNNLFEKDIGVTEFVGSAPGFTGVIKAR